MGVNRNLQYSTPGQNGLGAALMEHRFRLKPGGPPLYGKARAIQW
jgi:hypothetical protein